MEKHYKNALSKLENKLSMKINYLLNNKDDAKVRQLPGLVEALKDLNEIKNGVELKNE